jgi:hypothetical protein
MITKIVPERGGENAGVLRVEFSLPMVVEELRDLSEWFVVNGWSVEADQIDEFINYGRYFDADQDHG